MIRSITLSLVPLALLAAGCATYQPQPLDRPAVERALTPPTPEELRVQAAALQHPLLKPVAIDERDGLSPDEAAVIAVLVNPTLRMERDRRALADAQLLQAGILPNPTLNYSMDFPRDRFDASGQRINWTGWSVGPDWDVMELAGLRQRKNAAAAQVGAVELDVAWQEWQVAEAAKRTVYQLRVLEQQRDLAQEMDVRLEENLHVVEDAANRGLLTELDVAAAQTASDQAHTNLLNVEKVLADEKVVLNRVLGFPAGRDIPLQADLELPDHVAPPELDRFVQGLEMRRLDLVALQRGYASQEATVHAAVLGQFPRINLGFNRASDTSKVVTTGFGISIGLPLFDRNQGQIAIERATRQQLFDEYVSRVFLAQSDIAQALAAIRSLNALIVTAKAAEPRLAKLVETYRTAVQEGQADVLSYYTAWNDLTQKRFDLLQLKGELVDAQIALELAAGVYGVGDSGMAESASAGNEPSR